MHEEAPFYPPAFAQLSSTGDAGLFEGYYTHPGEQQFVSDLKRAIVKDLNPV
jgi:hypothetical protein